MNNKELLQKATSIYDIAKALHYKPSGLSYLIYKFDEPKPKYTEFEIEKKSGGKRKIKKPHDKIAKLQKTLLNLLNDIYEPKKCVQGFVKYNRNGNKIRRNIITNAELHSSKKYIINLDIQDFFPSINFGRVRGMFISKPYLFSAKASTIMAQIACDKNELPVGSPCSPIIANMVAEHLDYDIIKYIAKSKCNITYTRYADDMVFSFNNEKYMNCIFNAEQNKVSDELVKIVEKNGFKLQDNKSRLRTSSQRQEVTGLVCNKYANVKKEYFRNVRNMVHKFYHGCPDTSADVIRGSLAFLLHIKKHISKDNIGTQYKTLDHLLHKFNVAMINKYYADKKSLVILTEGQTDIIYYKEALKSYVKQNTEQKKIIVFEKAMFINLFQGKKGSGTTVLNSFYTEINKGKLKLNNKIVILVDNDDAGKKVKSIASKNPNANIIVEAIEDKTTIEDLLIVHKIKEKANPKLINKFMKKNNYSSIQQLLTDKDNKSKSIKLAKELVTMCDIDYSKFYSIFDKLFTKLH